MINMFTDKNAVVSLDHEDLAVSMSVIFFVSHFKPNDCREGRKSWNDNFILKCQLSLKVNDRLSDFFFQSTITEGWSQSLLN